MKDLRDPDKGCPWDRKQTMESIIPYSIEEMYEVAEQVYLKNYDNFNLKVKSNYAMYSKIPDYGAGIELSATF